MNKILLVGLFVAVLLGGGAYWTLANKPAPGAQTNQMPVTSGENAGPGSIHDMPVEPAAAQARKDLAVKLSVEEKSIVILQVAEATWSDGCLGLGGPAESCLQALVPGFSVELLAEGKTYTYRTDKTGAVLRAQTN